MGWLTEMFRAVAESMMFWRQKDAQRNAEPVVAAKVAQEKITDQDASEKAVAKADLEKMRKDMAE